MHGISHQTSSPWGLTPEIAQARGACIESECGIENMQALNPAPSHTASHVNGGFVVKVSYDWGTRSRRNILVTVNYRENLRPFCTLPLRISHSWPLGSIARNRAAVLEFP